MEITGLDFFLINVLSYVAGVATGLIVCCKNNDNLSLQQTDCPPPQVPYLTPPIVASAPIEKPVKITLE